MKTNKFLSFLLALLLIMSPLAPLAYAEQLGGALEGETSEGGLLEGDAPKVDALEGDTPKVDALEGDAPKVDALEGDAPKGDALEGDAPKVDALEGDTPKVDALEGDALKGSGSDVKDGQSMQLLGAPGDDQPTHLIRPRYIDITVNKDYVGGPKPAVELQLKRYVKGLPKKTAKVVETVILDGSEATAWEKTWPDMIEYSFPIEYIYFVEEKVVPTNYEKTLSKDGRTVTNTYVIPTDGSYTANKVWEGDEAVTRPTMVFDLYRKTEFIDEKVPGADAKEVDEDNTTASWDNLESTDFDGNYYIFYVKESFKEENIENDNWILGEDNDAKIFNHVISEKNARLTIGKELIEQLYAPSVFDGSTNQIKFSFLLTGPYGFEEEFDLYAGQEKVFDNLYYGSYNLLETSSEGYEAFYSNNGVDLSIENPEGEIYVENNHSIDEETGMDPNLVDVKASKIWINGPLKDREATDLLLFRSTGGKKHLVIADADIKVGGDSFHYHWMDLDKHSPEGYEYIYSVEEKGVVDGMFVVGDSIYEVGQDGNIIVNNFLVQKTDVKAHKIWVDAPSVKPNIWFKLYRKTDSGKLEEVPGAEILQVKNEMALWKQIDKTDFAGNHYYFSVQEVDKDGKDFVPQDYKKLEDGLVVKNTYMKPKEKLPSTGQSSMGMLMFAGFAFLGSGSLLLRRKKD